jgi:hypothetical protein
MRSVASSASGVTSSTRAVGPAMPALLTSTSSPPSAATALSTNASHSETAPASARIPLCPHAARAPSSTSETNTAAPHAAKLSAMTLPMPLAPALMATRSPLRSTVNGVLAPEVNIFVS